MKSTSNQTGPTLAPRGLQGLVRGVRRVASACAVWSRRRDLNPGPADYESAALPLSYAGEAGPRNAAGRRMLPETLAHAKRLKSDGLGRRHGSPMRRRLPGSNVKISLALIGVWRTMAQVFSRGAQ